MSALRFADLEAPVRALAVARPRVVVPSRLGDLRLRIRPAAPRVPWRLVLIAAALVPKYRRWVAWDCGNAECLDPYCAERLSERGKEAGLIYVPTHDPQEAVRRFDQWHDQMLDVIDGAAPLALRAAYVRPSRAKAEKPPKARVRAPLTRDEETRALATLQRRPIRRGVDRIEWLSDVWIELVDPPVGIETPTSLEQRIDRAVARAEINRRRAVERSASERPSFDGSEF